MYLTLTLQNKSESCLETDDLETFNDCLESLREKYLVECLNQEEIISMKSLIVTAVRDNEDYSENVEIAYDWYDLAIKMLGDYEEEVEESKERIKDHKRSLI